MRDRLSLVETLGALSKAASERVVSTQLDRRNQIVIEKLGATIDRLAEALRLCGWSNPVKEAPDYANDESMSLPCRGKSNVLVDEAVYELSQLIVDLSAEVG